LAASAVGTGGRQLVLVKGPHRRASLEETAGPHQAWQQLPTPPAGTVAVALRTDGSTDAFSVSGSLLRVYVLAPGGVAFTLEQRVDVPIAYGTSS
jgi:hypothetical protein